MGDLKPIIFKLSPETIATMDALSKRLGIRTRVDVLRHAVQRLADVELPQAAPTGPEKKSRKKGK